jgi:hypothetical protein
MSTFFDFTKHKVFGWVVHFKKLSAGQKYSVTVTEDIANGSTGNITLWTKGRIVGTDRNGVQAPPDRVPGMCSLSRTFAPAGTYDYVAAEDSEWWCINYTANRNQLPAVQVFTAAVGEVKNLPVGTKLFLCEGSVSFGETQYDAPAAFEISTEQATFVAGEQCYGFVFEEARS